MAREIKDAETGAPNNNTTASSSAPTPKMTYQEFLAQAYKASVFASQL